MGTKAKFWMGMLGLPFLFTTPVQGQELSLPSLRVQHEIRMQWLKARLEQVLPRLMRERNVDMWLVICREYNEDPVFFSLVAPTTFAARRRTIYVFYDRGPEKGLERLALGGGDQGGLYQVYRDPEVENRELWGQSQWALLRKLIEERQPRRIAVNISQTHAFSDGLSVGEYEQLVQALGPKWTARLVREERLALDYLAERVPGMLDWYRRLMQIAHALISRAFSREVITPGLTTTEDVIWWLRQQLADRGLDTWFQPSVRVQRMGGDDPRMLTPQGPVTIQRGDVLHVDFGIRAMGLATDTQHMGYVLREGEQEPPPGIQRALAIANRLQDIVMENLKVGLTGNQVLLNALRQMRAEGINGSVYSHPVGDHGHGAGPLIGLWDRQEPIPGRGDVEVRPNTWFSIELSVRVPIPEWGNQELWVGLEEDAAIGPDGRVSWVLTRQTRYHLVR
ncbi:MAG: aminopeptidase P family protein [Bacteroidetes bacterium]|nr:aminopeptidase P family protein [Bacteroidota bacterium]